MDKFSFLAVPINLADAIYNSLLYSIWQGALLAIAAGLVLNFTKTPSPTVRYNVLVCLLLAFNLSLVWTFLDNLNIPVEELNAKHGILIRPNPAGQAWKLLSSGLMWLQVHENQVLLLWFSCVFFKAIQFLLGFHWMGTLKVAALPVTVQWDQKLKELCNHLRMVHSVQLLQSGITQVPLVLGYFKPIIILPIGLITALPSDQIEAILLHELAHIYRKDYLVNFLQNILEILLFFNPGLLWVSKMIRKEREHCCDDIAIQYTKEPVTYMHALVNFREFQIESKTLALPFSGERNLTMERLRRLTTGQNTLLSGIEKSLLGLIFVTALILIPFLGQNAKKTNDLSATNVSKDLLEQKRIAEARMPNLRQDLIEDGIITNGLNLSYKLDEQEMIVNNKKQPDAIHQKYRIKYVGNSGGVMIQNSKF